MITQQAIIHKVFFKNIEYTGVVEPIGDIPIVNGGDLSYYEGITIDIAAETFELPIVPTAKAGMNIKRFRCGVMTSLAILPIVLSGITGCSPNTSSTETSTTESSSKIIHLSDLNNPLLARAAIIEIQRRIKASKSCPNVQSDGIYGNETKTALQTGDCAKQIEVERPK